MYNKSDHDLDEADNMMIPELFALLMLFLQNLPSFFVSRLSLRYALTIQIQPLFTYQQLQTSVASLSALVIAIGSGALIMAVSSLWLHHWASNPFSISVVSSIGVIGLLAVIPLLVAALPMAYLFHYPPRKWMGNRLDRLTLK
jgi:hypothetical protein